MTRQLQLTVDLLPTGGSVLKPGSFTSIIEVTRFQFLEFTVDIKELALWFGRELARMIVDELLFANKQELAN